MGGISSGRHPHIGGPLKQVALKFPTNSAWFLLAKRICRYREISFNEFVRTVVEKEVKNIKYTKMWTCECTDLEGKRQYNFKKLHYCNHCRQYQSKFHEGLYNRK